ncbi:MAG: hypothetical protein M2R45_03119 [Verrucomicrobia subdivision 3 bacterium]|nr:hypothetical protein [Limisphaerales bacterium]MCS1413187.1 hypothetical protein [Limisphaerales bacterium]
MYIVNEFLTKAPFALYELSILDQVIKAGSGRWADPKCGIPEDSGN